MSEVTTQFKLIEELWMSSQYGIPQGEIIDVQAGSIGLIVRNGETLYRLAPNHYLLSDEYFPGLKLNRSFNGQKPAYDAIYYSLCTDPLEPISWELQFVSKSSVKEGASFTSLQGTYEIRVSDPSLFFQRVSSELQADAKNINLEKSFQLTNARKQQDKFVADNIAAKSESVVTSLITAALATVMSNQNIVVITQKTDLDSMKKELFDLIKSEMESYGMTLISLTVDSISAIQSLPCQICFQNDSPVAYVGFYSNVSLFIVRYYSQHIGYFCTTCSLKKFFSMTGVTLLMGWWGIIGAIISPFLILFNLFNLCKLALCRRMPPGTEFKRTLREPR